MLCSPASPKRPPRASAAYRITDKRIPVGPYDGLVVLKYAFISPKVNARLENPSLVHVEKISFENQEMSNGKGIRAVQEKPVFVSSHRADFFEKR